MGLPKELRLSFTVNAAALGAAFVSGQEAAAFFTCAGPASWPGVCAAGLTFGLLTGMLCRLVNETGASTLPGAYGAGTDQRWGDFFGVTHALLMLAIGAAALSAIGHVTRLALNGGWAAPLLCGGSVLLASLLNFRGVRAPWVPSLAAVTLILAFFTALALDSRTPSAAVYRSVALPSVYGSFPAALLLGVLFAFLKAAVAGGVAAQGAGGLRPGRFGLCCGLLFAILALAANRALLAAGPDVPFLSLPAVALAARWGIPGYYLALAALYLGAFCTLCCSLGSLRVLLPARISPFLRTFLVAAAVSLASVDALQPLVSVACPALGWVCALCLGIPLFLRQRRRPSYLSALLRR